MALSRAGLGEGCIHALDARCYREGDDPLALEERVISDGELGATDVPCECGDAVVWDGRTVHWGGAVDADAAEPRRSLAFAFSSPESTDEVERINAMRAWSGEGKEAVPPLPCLEARLRLVAMQLWFYADVQPLAPHVERLLGELFEEDDVEDRDEQEQAEGQQE